VIALTQKDVLAHEVAVPWSEPYQIEQDLLLCLVMHAIFEDRFLSGQVAMRGGTVLHKVHLARAARYSADIDLVAIGDRPEGHIRKALLRVLRHYMQAEGELVEREKFIAHLRPTTTILPQILHSSHLN
jgi:predicted nucleotidyltransferase component of viral defense system